MIISKKHQDQICQFIDDDSFKNEAMKAHLKYTPFRSFDITEEGRYDILLRCWNYVDNGLNGRFLVIAKIVLAENFRAKGHFSKILQYLDSINPFDGLSIESASDEMTSIAIHKGFKIFSRQIGGGSPNLYRLRQIAMS
jgi:hypothetical protein